jgi:hypothetical protein
VWAGVDSVWEQEKLEARKMPENAARREAAVPHVRCTKKEWGSFFTPETVQR